jgi:16S rRNA (guanine(527)-N(7))-methyltransferase RsmG
VRLLRVTSSFEQAITDNRSAFGLSLTSQQIARLADYFQLVQEHNSLLHLVAPCPAEEFAVRHILESLTLLEHLPQNSKFADVGAGAGLPSIPCLLVRDDLSAILIETKEKKARFLALAVEQLDLGGRAAVVNRQFEEVMISDCEFVTCRALDKFAERLPRVLNWAKGRSLLLFGGPNLAAGLEKLGFKFERRLLPLSDQRFLFVIAEY